MELSPYFKSIIDTDRCAVVICNLQHEIIYMNPAAVRRYAKRGGAQLIGKNLLACHNADSQELIRRVVAWFAESPEHEIMYTAYDSKENKDVYMIALRNEEGVLIGYYEKHEYRTQEKSERYSFKN